MRHQIVLALVLAVAAGPAAAAPGPLRVLVTNDDGVGAAGIAAVVQALAANPQLELTVVAPATNQSGTGDRVTTGAALTVTDTTTAAGFPAKAVSGFPADCVLVGRHVVLGAPPDLVVSGINDGQNVADFARLSGTVGAATTAARLGIPAIAASQGGGPGIDFTDAAAFVASLVERFRTNGGFRARLRAHRGGPAVVLNVNFPTCTAGTRRGVRVLPLGRFAAVVGYTPGAPGMVTPVVETTNFLTSDCTSTLSDPADDGEAFANGFATVTPLAPDQTVGALLRRFRALER